MSCGSMSRYGTSHTAFLSIFARAAMPFRIASWWLPLNAVNTSSPTYGIRGWISIPVNSLYCSAIEGTSWKSSSGSTPSENRSEEHTSELQSPDHLVCRLLLEKKKKQEKPTNIREKRERDSADTNATKQR